MEKKFDIDSVTSLVRLSHAVCELDSLAVLLSNDHLISNPTYEGILKIVRNDEDTGIQQDWNGQLPVEIMCPLGNR